MAEPLKNVYNKSFIEEVATHCKAVIPTFNKEAFLKNCLNSEWDNMELKQRMRHISLCLDQQLTGNYNKDVAILAEIAQHIIKTTGKKNTFEYLFLPDLIERKGATYANASLNAIEHITKLSSCEFAIRPIIAANVETSMKTLLKWATNSDTSVRRLASEGCRPRLPWGMALQQFKKDPSPILPILDVLKNDSSEYVRRSVANNLNDIAKDNPEIAIALFNKWKGISPEVDKLLKHGSRTLLKQGHTEILALFGTGSIPSLAIQDVNISHKTIKIGDDQHFTFSFSHKEGSSVKVGGYKKDT